MNEPPSSAASSASGAGSRATPVTWAPALLSATAMARPKPRLAPVTIAFRPAMSVLVMLVLLDWSR